MIRENTTPASEIIVSINADLQELIGWYLDKRAGDVKTLSEKILQGDFETIRIIGHSMKGSGGSYGFGHITAIGQELEKSARTRNAEGVSKGIEALSRFLHKVKVRYV